MTSRMTSIVSRMCATGLPYPGMPKRPSTQARMDVPRPRMNRPPATRSRSIVVIAVSKGLRVNAIAMPLASWTCSVTAAQYPRPMKGEL